MAYVDNKQVWKKTLKCLSESKKAQMKIKKVIDNYMINGRACAAIKNGDTSMPKPLCKAGDKFIRNLSKTIRAKNGSDMSLMDGGLSKNGAKSVSESVMAAMKSEKPVRVISNGNATYVLRITHSGDELHRETMAIGEAAQKYRRGADNILDLLNSGYEANHAIQGVWHGEVATSLYKRDGAHFIERAIDSFKDNNEFGIDKIIIGKEYRQ